MGTKIWHQSFTTLARLPGYDQALRAHIKKVTRPDTEVVMHGMHAETYNVDYPGTDISFAYVQRMHMHQFAYAAIVAEEQGFDAYAMTTLPEPGLREIRSLVSIPVVAYGESAMLAACQLGLRFGVLLFIDGIIPQIQANVREHGLEGRCMGVRHVGFQFDDVLAAFDDPQPVIDRFFVAARRMIADGVDVIIPGEAPMNVFLQRNGVNRVDDVPILDGVATTMKAAEMMVDMRRQLGIWRSTRGYYQALPPRARIKEIAEFYGIAKLFEARPAGTVKQSA